MPRALAIRLLVSRLPVDPDLDAAGGRPLSRRLTMCLVALGGAAGALARALVQHTSAAAGDHGSGWPWDTFAINITGSLLLGALLAWLHEAAPRAPVPRPLLGTGFCGGFTTFSTFALQVDGMTRSGRLGLAVLYVGTTTVAAVVAAALGVVAARAAVRIADRETWLRRVRHAHQSRNGGDR